MRLSFKTYWAVTTGLTTCLGAGSGGGIGYAMYDDAKVALLSLWTFPETVVGDVVVTMLIIGVLTTLTSSQLTKRDLAMGMCNRLIVIHSPPNLVRFRPLRVLHNSLCGPGAPRSMVRVVVDCFVVGLLLGACTTLLVGVPFIVAGWLWTGDEWTRTGFAWFKACVGALTCGLVHALVCYTVSAGDDKRPHASTEPAGEGET